MKGPVTGLWAVALALSLWPWRALAQGDLQQQVDALYGQGRYREALPLAVRLVAVREAALGGEHERTLCAVSSLAEVYRKLGDNAAALPLYRRLMAIRERRDGPDGERTAEATNNLAAILLQMGEVAQARPLFQRALLLMERHLGAHSPITATAMFNLGVLESGGGRAEDAERWYRRALDVRERILGRSDPVTALTLASIAAFYEQLGRYAAARAMYERALKVQRERLGADHPDTAASLAGLGAVTTEMGREREGRRLLEQALALQERRLGPQHPSLVTTLARMAQTDAVVGDLARAEAEWRRAADIGEATLGAEHPTTIRALHGLARLYILMGDRARATALFERIRPALERALATPSINTAVLLVDMATFHAAGGDAATSETLLRRAIAIWDRIGPRHPYAAMTRLLLGGLCEGLGRFDEAEGLAREALAIDGASLDARNPAFGDALLAMGRACHGRGDRARAATLYRAALQRYASQPPTSPRRYFAWIDLMRLKADQDRGAEALHYARAAQGLLQKLYANALSFTSEAQRLAVQQEWNPYEAMGGVEDGPGMAEAVLHFKGIVLDSLLEDAEVARASRDPRLADMVGRLRAARRSLGAASVDTLPVAQMLMTDRGAHPRKAPAAEAGRDTVEALEKRLAAAVGVLGRTRRALAVRVSEVVATLPADAALVELVRYHAAGRGLRSTGWRYGAVVLAPRLATPRWIALGAADPMDAAVRALLRAVRRTGRSDRAVAAASRTVYARAWAPLEAALPRGTRTVVISPDSALHFVPFAALLAPNGAFVGERRDVLYVACGRDLLKPARTARSREAVFFADPAFDAVAGSPGASSRGTALRALERGDLERGSFPPLPGTARECLAIARLAAHQGEHVRLLQGAAASERSLRALHAPRLLHLATHGYFLDAPAQPIAEASADPIRAALQASGGAAIRWMDRSGLVLSGAGATQRAWARQETPAADDDGFVTAEDVAGLDLEGTWLVTLSACETALGEALPSEGVLGLRRGFVQAGARNLLMTLWPVADDPTAGFMVDFYRGLERAPDPPRVLARVQRAWLRRLHRERGVHDAVRTAGPFVLTFQGALAKQPPRP